MSKRLAVLILLGILTSSTVSEEGWFWHVTDFHYDFSYWSDQLSCNGRDPASPGEFGNQWCDSPWKLIEETVSGMKEIRSDVDFMLWTGDSVPHVASSNLSTELNKELVRNITSLMKTEFPGVSILATFGNHDYYKTNLFPPHGNEIYNATYDIWKEWINDTSQEANFLKGGYYSVKTSENIQVIALNTNMYYTKDTLTQNLTDPADQFAWLESELQALAASGTKVILTGHVPPGFTTPRAVRWMSPAFNTKFIEILKRHSHVITGVHFGHEHHDNFRVLYNDTGSPSVAIFIAPSVTPWRYQIGSEVEPAHNPGARLVKYDRQTGKQLDILQYYFDLDTANSAGKVNWTLGYAATDLYKLPDISPASMDVAIQKMKPLDSLEFQAYINWYNTNAKEKVPCDSECHALVLCGLKNLDEQSFAQCIKDAVNSSSFLSMNCVILVTHLLLLRWLWSCF